MALSVGNPTLNITIGDGRQIGNVISVARGAITNGAVGTIPDGSYVLTPATTAASSVSIIINLATADKLFPGNRLLLQAYRSIDGTDATAELVASAAWESYGPGGNPGNPRHGIAANPDPTINLDAAQVAGYYVQIRYQFNGNIGVITGAKLINNATPLR